MGCKLVCSYKYMYFGFYVYKTFDNRVCATVRCFCPLSQGRFKYVSRRFFTDIFFHNYYDAHKCMLSYVRAVQRFMKTVGISVPDESYEV